ncbi:MAG: hypothetical protein ACK5FE_10710 [Cyanobacteriota bacterium]|jgi:hypothetical protein
MNRRLLVLLLLGLASVPAPATATRANASWPLIRDAFLQRGFKVVEIHPRCREKNLFGLYERLSRTIIVCPRGNQVDTLMHEGWHAVQSRCLHGRPVLSVDQLNQGLSRADRRDLSLYDARQQGREAEARVMARLPPDRYFLFVDRYCVPAAPGGATAPVAAQESAPAPGPAAPVQRGTR